MLQMHDNGWRGYGQRAANTSLSAEPSSVAAGRRFVRDTLKDWGVEGERDNVELVASELITNAVLHAGTSPTVTIELLGDCVRLEIADGSARPPILRHYELDAATGRGIMLVESMATRWGTEVNGSGKVVWCEFPLS